MISIIIPTLNEEHQIGELVHYLKSCQQGYIREIIVADGGSRDRTKRIAAHSGAIVVKCKNSGRASQMNEGAAIAAGPVFYFLHADTRPPEAFDRLIIERIRQGAVAGCFQLRFDDSHPLLTFYSKFTRLRTTLVRFGDQSLFVKRDRFYHAGGFDESLKVMEDQEMVRRLKKGGGAFCLVEEAVVTSSRKYRANGVVRLQLIFVLIFGLYYAGVKQETLVHIYTSLTGSGAVLNDKRSR